MRTDHDDGTTGVVHPFAEQILTKTALFTLEHVGKGFKRPLVWPGNNLAAPAVVEKNVHCLLQHPLLVADNDLRGIQFQQALQPIVPVNYPAVEIIEIGSGETSAFQGHQGAQIRGQHRDNIENHPIGLVAGLMKGLNHIEPLGQFFPLSLGTCFPHLLTKHLGQRLKLELLHHLLNGCRADTNGELAGKIFLGLSVAFFGQQGADRQGRLIGGGNNIGIKIKNLFQFLQGHIENIADLARQALQKPDMGHGCGQFDMPQPFPPNL